MHLQWVDDMQMLMIWADLSIQILNNRLQQPGPLLRVVIVQDILQALSQLLLHYERRPEARLHA